MGGRGGGSGIGGGGTGGGESSPWGNPNHLYRFTFEVWGFSDNQWFKFDSLRWKESMISNGGTEAAKFFFENNKDYGTSGTLGLVDNWFYEKKTMKIDEIAKTITISKGEAAYMGSIDPIKNNGMWYYIKNLQKERLYYMEEKYNIIEKR